MTSFLLMRHAQPDFTGLERLKAAGWPVDIAPLDPSGEQQVIGQMKQIAEFSPEIIISSPLTRALQTAVLVLVELRLPFRVEFDLRDWMPDLRYHRLTMDELRARQSEFNGLKGEWPEGETRPWETASNMHQRVSAVLGRYLNHRRVMAVSHQRPIQAVTGASAVELAGLRYLELQS